jgi:8-oxo-dGTP pyrophosphatase MutT (NUDIX family)
LPVNLAEAHSNLGGALTRRGKLDEAGRRELIEETGFTARRRMFPSRAVTNDTT